MIKKKRFWILILYVALLAVSFGVRNTAESPKPSPHKKFSEVSLEGSPPVRIAYKESGSVDEIKLPIVMIHGSPGSAEAFDGLVESLPGRHIISVDLPGFGDSERSIPDYSIEAHAHYLEAFLKQKGIETAHFVGFSLGGGVVLHLAESQPKVVHSITFISSIGVQEYELFGDYYLNHAVHGFQLGFAWFLQELTPHFGLFDGGMIEYSRNFWDTDQRPLRKLLLETKAPFLILHGKDDPLVPVEAAREHARIVPHSEYHELEDNHFFVFMRPETISGRMDEFWKRVEDGKAVTRYDAREDRTSASTSPFVYQVVAAKGPVIFCFFLMILLVALINEDVAAVIAGVLIAQGRFGLVMPLIAFTIAIIVSGFFWRRIGRRRRGITLKSYFPFSADPGKANAYGFRFLDYVNRSRDSFFHFTGAVLGFGILRMILIGLCAYLLVRGLVMSGFMQNTSTLVLLVLGFLVYLGKALGFRIFLSERKFRRR